MTSVHSVIKVDENGGLKYSGQGLVSVILWLHLLKSAPCQAPYFDCHSAVEKILKDFSTF